ncbi:hypothetical protein A3A64_03580 [Candidatus Gottesmanbacteria bacterium RIFCSPLOWO2_01_FULL_48_11]|uniref:HAD family hydrolase n=1 Tax=Candidatus Gottesmanbacteria bacterium RIFCSPLOWO2_01_FULL_48_11 TaxID=1798395 RepID=A0A1F6AUN3_9BACT|nr:MAG: hypothetical protein A3A64_03580 [Candidatus Gottesmanbacteria bacterium RIFCSPLOWO2_01_FULL_48_11]
MDNRFRNVTVLIWDFDGTLYAPNPALWKEIREGEYRTIMAHTGWPREQAVAEFEKLHKTVYPSATETVAQLIHLPIADAASEMEQYFDRTKYLTRDEKLIALFAKLKQYRHFTLANGIIANHKKALDVLGVPAETFEEMVTAETVGITKPHPEGFRYILRKTGLPAEQHLMIGDREGVDLVPAKALGMKTCLVWAKNSSSIANVSLPTVYGVANLVG